GLVVAVPILAGSLLRVRVGMLTDRFGGKRVGAALLAFLFVPLALARAVTPSLGSLLAIGALLGTAGASFAVALPLASRWFPPGRQGLAMGVAAAGNSGTVMTNLFAPWLAAAIGLPATFGLAMLGLAAVLVAFLALAHEPPRAARARLPSLRDRDLRWLCGFYAITFGGYIGLVSFLPLYLREAHGVTPVTAGYITAGLALLGSGARPIGGLVSDRLGGGRVLAFLLVPIALAYGCEATQPALPVMVALLGISMLGLGLGNGAVFQIVALRFPREIGGVTGVIGALGGLGGFVLPTLLGGVREYLGTFGYGFAVLAALAGAAAVSLRVLIVGGAAPAGAWGAGARS
ncbi:MAG TPA: MFS transporter, partial [Kofleriaceae bacterium]|nr:MFS transporter [Kofleriaceae bacterium]